MIDTPSNVSERGHNFVCHLRDGYRSIRGKGAKYTLVRTPAAPQAAPPTLRDFHSHSVSETEWALLEKLVQESAQFDGPIIEVGVLAGQTTQRIAAAKQASQKILAVDNFCWNPWGLQPEEHWTLVKLSLGYLTQTNHVEICRIDKNKFYETYQGPAPSLVFVDAMHDYEETKKDLMWAKSVGAKIICGHDYKDEFPGVIQIVDELGGPRLLADSVFVL